MTNQEKRDNAEELFIEFSMSKTNIARQCGVSTNTITKWADEGKWNEVRAKKLSVEKNIKIRIFDLIDYQLEVLEEWKAEQRKSGKKKELLDKGAIDSLSKLLAGIKTREMSFAQSVDFLMKFTNYVDEQDNALAQQLIPFSDGFIAFLRKEE